MTTTTVVWTVGDRLRKARELAGHDRKAFAALLGVSRNSIARWESGNELPRPVLLYAWSACTGASLEWLKDESGIPPTRGTAKAQLRIGWRTRIALLPPIQLIPAVA